MGETKYLIEKENTEKELALKLHKSELLATPNWVFLLMIAFALGVFLFMVGLILVKVINEMF